MKPLLAVFAFALLAAASPVLAAPKQGDAIIRHVTIIDVEAAKAVAGQAVVLKGDDIIAVGADAAIAKGWRAGRTIERSDEHTSELQSLMRNSYAGFCLQKKNN